MGDLANGAGVGAGSGRRCDVARMSADTSRRRRAAHVLTGAALVALVLLAGATLVAACGSSKKAAADGRTLKTAYTEANNKDTVALKVGQQIFVTLKENPSTGYSWNVKLANGLAMVSTEFTAPSTSPPLAGAGGKRTWVIRADNAGMLKFSGVYVRSWEKKGKKARSFSLTINAKQ